MNPYWKQPSRPFFLLVRQPLGLVVPLLDSLPPPETTRIQSLGLLHDGEGGVQHLTNGLLRRCLPANLCLCYLPRHLPNIDITRSLLEDKLGFDDCVIRPLWKRSLLPLAYPQVGIDLI